MFTVFTSNDSNSKNVVHNGNTVTILRCSSIEDQMFMVSRYDASGTAVSWFAHVDELSNFDGVL